MARIKYANLYSDKKPTDYQLKRLREFLVEKYKISEIRYDYDEDVKNGFKLAIGDQVYDWTVEGRIRQLKSRLDTLDDTKSAMPLIRNAVNDFKPLAITEEIGTVTIVRDGIAFITGLPTAEYNEILLFDTGVKGLVLDLRNDCIGCVLFDDEEFVSEGDSVFRTGNVAGMPVGENFIGRVIDVLGNPIDGGDKIEADKYLPIERPAPGIIDRQPVNKPLETGILAIDAMFPIGRGQRELLIGDRRTGKTAIAIDTIINQKGKNVICIYVAIGQKASTVASLVASLKEHGAMDYTVIINSSASDAAPLQYIAPYAGCSMGEFFMTQGRDVLIIYDDLSKHAIAYRTISLLLGRTPGREAYPGDIFYLHSRLLERSAHMSDELGGGSLTALPIVETQAGDVSAYIPTNVISITDGQIFLESDLFFSGQRPAINIGISVSRVGGEAQTKAVKNAAGTLRLDLSQYREMEAFTQFAGDLDAASKDKLYYGKSLMHILQQGRYCSISRHRQVIYLIVSLAHKVQNLEGEKINAYLNKVCEQVEALRPDIVNSIEQRGIMPTDGKQDILTIADETEL